MECAAHEINRLRVTLKRKNVWCVITLLSNSVEVWKFGSLEVWKYANERLPFAHLS